MSNSSLATYVDRSSGNYNRRTSEIIDRIVIHSAMSRGDCTTLSSIINSSMSSFHYGIAEDGTIGLYVDELYRAWSTGNTDNDHRSVSIVVCNSSLAPSYQISAASYNSLIKLCTDICRRNFIQKLTYTGKLSGSNLVMHSWFSNVSCPGPYLKNKFSTIASTVTAQLSKVSTATSQTEALKSQSSIVVSAIDPYVVTVVPGATGIDYAKLKLMGAVGAMFYAGCLYNNNEPVRPTNETYRSSSLVSQLDELGTTLPFALYATTRAKTANEAKAECEQLYYVISKFPPQLGIWVHLDLSSSSVTVNNTIIDTYYKYFYKWGLHDKCGIYCTKDQLAKITWANYSDKMSLWIVSKISSMSNLPSLLVPNFFKL